MSRFLLRHIFLTLLLLLLLSGFARASASDLPEEAPLEDQPSTSFVPKEKITIRINIPATRLDLYIDGEFKKSYKIAVGMPKYPTPIRDLNISYIIWNPWWLPPDSEWAQDAEKTPPGPGNPLGPVKMLMEDGIRIHGTNAPATIGRAASHACMRMKSADAKELAWEIQQRYSEKNDPQLLETYKKNSKKSYWVKLAEEVPVEVEYKQVELQDNQLLLHPDRYSRGGFQEEVEETLASHSEIVVDKQLLKKLSALRSKGSTEISLTQIKQWSEAEDPAPPQQKL
jgi:L,D-transpeptidase-like protein